MYIVGIDIAKRSHEAVIIDSDGNILKKAFNFKNNHEGFNKLLSIMQKFGKPDEFIIGMESTSHYWLALYSQLHRREFNVQVINPIQSNALRGMYIRQIKNDEHDSFIIAEVIRFGRYTEGGLPPSKLYELRELCRARLFIVDMVSDLKRKVISLLDQVFPEYENIFSNIFGHTSSEILRTCSTPEEILAFDTDKLAEIISIQSRKRYGLEKAEELKETAANSFGVLLGVNSMSLLIKQYLEHIRFTENQIKDIDEKIAQIFSEFDTYITTIPGIGPVLGAIIFSEIGDISRFSSSSKLAAFAGIDPTVKQSGQFSSTHNHMSKRGSPYLRRAIWQASVLAATVNPEMKAFLQKKKDEGKPYMNAIGHITKKMTNIIYAVLRDNKPFYYRTHTAT